ncbi:hypothetical protein Q3G72_020950 [Acer saccharum]|nr:hypothetical protein Q3G72_020950 [Acer saccharum]
MPRAGSSEEPQLSQPQSAAGGGVQPNVNPGGSAHHPQLTEAQIAANYEIGTAEHLNYYRSLHIAAKRGYHDIALYFVRKDPKLALANDYTGQSLLYWLASNPSYFFSGSNLGLIKRWIYKFVHVEIKYPSTHSDPVTVIVEDPALQPRSLANRVLQWLKRLLWKAIIQLAPSVDMAQHYKCKENYSGLRRRRKLHSLFEGKRKTITMKHQKMFLGQLTHRWPRKARSG